MGFWDKNNTKKIEVPNPDGSDKKEFDGRVYDRNGEKYVSVTSVLNPEGIPEIPDYILNQFAARGSIVHAQTEHFDEYGEIPNPKNLDGWKIKNSLQTLENGSLDICYSECDYKAFMETFGEAIEYEHIEALIFNDEYKYGGRADRLGSWKGEKAIFDIKTSKNYPSERLQEYFMQMSAYAAPYKGIKRLVIIPLNPDKNRGFEPPIIRNEVEGYFEKFKDKLKSFHEIYKI